MPQGGATLDEKTAKEDAAYDGKFVLRTTTSMPATEVAEAYKRLGAIERLWREMKSVLEMRPICRHKVKRNITGHIFGAFLALYLTAFLKTKYVAAEEKVSWDGVIRDLSALTAIHLKLHGDYYLMRPPLKGCAGRVLQIAGVRQPAVAERVTGPDLPRGTRQVKRRDDTRPPGRPRDELRPIKPCRGRRTSGSAGCGRSCKKSPGGRTDRTGKRGRRARRSGNW